MNPSILTDVDLAQVRQHGLSRPEVERQLRLFADPPPAAELLRACTVGDGIVRLEEDRHSRLQDLYREAEAAGRFSKFVPASGAATRMFRALLAVRGGEGSEQDRQAARTLMAELDRLPFRAPLAAELERRGQDLEALRQQAAEGGTEEVDAWAEPVLSALLDDDGLGFANAPKGLVPFHRGSEEDKAGITPLEEHLVEAAEHLRAKDGRCRVHFTIPQHQEMAFREQLREIAGRLEPRYDARFEVSLSIQRPETDTLAADLDGNPFRDDDGRLVFRPGGHGALLTNLAEFGQDLVFLRNIDNVQPEHRRREILRWNRILGGFLVEVEQTLVDCLSRVERERFEDPTIDDELRRVAAVLGQPHLLEVLDRPPRAKQAFLADLLDRPLRIAGVVPNVGEPGGGPFWVRGADGEASPQIVEMSQVDLENPEQKAIVSGATHFNPVHLVCRLRSHRGDRYDLERFLDPSAVFIARKSHQGRPLQALERPGLWNGAMARWNTVFVEIPGTIFAPVKTVLDLLRPEHQAP